MQRLTLALPGNEDFAGRLAQAYGSDVGRVETRRFPDGESYVRLHGEPVGQIVDLICTLTQPDPQYLHLVFAADPAALQAITPTSLLGAFAVFLASINIFGGFAVTERMLDMFKKKKK